MLFWGQDKSLSQAQLVTCNYLILIGRAAVTIWAFFKHHHLKPTTTSAK